MSEALYLAYLLAMLGAGIMLGGVGHGDFPPLPGIIAGAILIGVAWSAVRVQRSILRDNHDREDGP